MDGGADMTGRSGALIAAVVTSAMVAGCGSSPAHVAGTGTPSLSASESPSALRVAKCPPPAPSLTISAQHHAGNEWVLPLGRNGVTVRFAVTQRAGVQVQKLWFEVAPANAPYPGSAVRRFAPSML